jgi:hypothetical protein
VSFRFECLLRFGADGVPRDASKDERVGGCFIGYKIFIRNPWLSGQAFYRLTFQLTFSPF